MEYKMYFKLNSHIFPRFIEGTLQVFDFLEESFTFGDLNSFVFLKHLSYVPQHIDDLTSKIYAEFSPAPDMEEFKKDAFDFFTELYSLGIVSKGITLEECDKNEVRFNYSNHDIFSSSVKKEHNSLSEKMEDIISKPLLRRVVLEITKFCNERCVQCYIPHENKNIRISCDDFFNIIDQCTSIGSVTQINITGGECMTHPDFKDFIRYVKEKGFALSLLTNGTLIDDEIIDILSKGALSKVQVSLFSLDPKVHDSITQLPGSLEKTLANIQKLRKANIPVAIATQVLDLNHKSIPDLFEYAKQNKFEIRCSDTIIAKEDLNSDNLQSQPKSAECFADVCRTRIKYSPEYYRINMDLLRLPPKGLESRLCNAGFNAIKISPDLKAHICTGWNLELGDLRKTKLIDIWENSPEIKRIRNITLADFPKCSKCDIRNICTICMAQAYNANNGKFEMPEFICEINKVIKRTCEEE